jgi:pilus assembly protein CpaE
VSIARTRILLLVADGVDEGAVRLALPPGAMLRTSTIRESLDRTAQLLEDVDPDVVLIGCSSYSEPSLEVMRKIGARRSDCPIVVLYEGNPNGFMDQAFDAGADDLIVLPQPAEHVAFAIEKVIARRRGPASPRAGSMIVVLGPKGGTGKTLTACNLAVALAEEGARPMLVDLDLQFGDVGLALGLRPGQTIYDLAVSGGTLDAEKVDSFLVAHDSGLRALLAPVRPDQAGAIEVGLLRRLFELLRSRYDFVIVDTPPAFSPEVIAAIDSASELCVVGMLDALSLKDTKLGLETLAQMGYDSDAITVVLNRADSNVGITERDVAQLLGRSPDVLVPSDRTIPRTLTHGRAVVEAEPKSGAARAFKSLAAHYLQGEYPSSTAHVEATASADKRVGRRALLRRAS